MTSSSLRLPVLLGIVTAVLSAAATLALLMTATPVWSSTAVLSIDQPRALAASDDAGIIDKLSRLRFKYIGLIGTDRLAVPVAKRLDEEVDDVRGRLTGQARITDLLLRATATDDTAAGARRTAGTLAEVLREQVAQEQSQAGVAPTDQVTLVVVREATGATKVAPGGTRSAASAGLVGLLAGTAMGGGLALRGSSTRRNLFA